MGDELINYGRWVKSQNGFIILGLLLLPGFPVFYSTVFLLHANKHKSAWRTSLVVRPLAKNLPCNAGGAGSIPGQKTEIPHVVEQLSPQA